MLEKKLEGNEVRDAKLELGNWLKNRREEIGRSQGDIAKHMQFQNLNFISKIERGAGAVPLFRLEDLAQAYQVDFHEFAARVIKTTMPDVWSVLERFINADPNTLKNIIKSI